MARDALMNDLSALAADLIPLDTAFEPGPVDVRLVLDRIRAAGGSRWAIPKEYGGAELSDVDQLRAYDAIASGSLSMALIQTQRDAACRLIARSPNRALRERLLPALARGERFTSVGISQLTTSRGQGGAPKMRGRLDDDAIVIDGVMPWVTGAPFCDYLVTGADLEDSRQVLGVAWLADPGVSVQPAMRLLALTSSHTCAVTCEGVRIEQADIIRGPMPAALGDRAPVRSLVVSAVGVGLARRIVNELRNRANKLTGELAALVERLTREFGEVSDRLYDAAARLGFDEDFSKESFRAEVNALLARLAITLLNVAKGSGYCQPHVAERLLREAMFLQVWSAPTTTQTETLRRLFREGE
ncbi:MAG: acyl-CoA/acyl-ACP dehydrogenase [Phycisphaerales bacterium]|nr:acyl-CoA/acyl-ACP dehydrogenase [Phycisphaerales bacterium]